MCTITLPNSEHDALSSYHTYCVDVRPGHLDHRSFIDWYLAEIKELIKGKEYYCGVREVFIYHKVSSSCCIGRSTRESIFIKNYVVGHVWRKCRVATAIMPNVMADCNSCFKLRLNALFKDQTNPVEVPYCRNCIG